MEKIKLKLTAHEFRVLHDLVSYLLVVLNNGIRGANLTGRLREKQDFVLLQKVVQKKMAAKVVMLQTENSLPLTLDEAIAFYIRANGIDVAGLDVFTGALICAVLGEIEQKIFNHVGFYGKDAGQTVSAHHPDAEAPAQL